VVPSVWASSQTADSLELDRRLRAVKSSFARTYADDGRYRMVEVAAAGYPIVSVRATPNGHDVTPSVRDATSNVTSNVTSNERAVTSYCDGT